VPATDLEVEKGPEEIEVRVVRPGRFTISATVRGQTNAHPAECRVEESERRQRSEAS